MVRIKLACLAEDVLLRSFQLKIENYITFSLVCDIFYTVKS